MTVLYALLVVAGLGMAGLATSVRVITQYERGVIFRFGRVEVAAEKNSTLVLPFPVELLRFLEKATPAEPVAATPAQAPAGASNGASNGVPIQRAEA